MKNIAQEVGSRIRIYRINKGLTQEQLAELAELHNTYIGQIERGEKNLSVNSLDRILRALNVSYGEFFEFADIKKYNKSPARICYEIISRKNTDKQQKYLSIICEIDNLNK